MRVVPFIRQHDTGQEAQKHYAPCPVGGLPPDYEPTQATSSFCHSCSTLAIQPRIGITAFLIAIIACLAVPLFGCGTILSYAFARFVHDTEVKLGASISLSGSFLEPFLGVSIILSYALSIVVHDAKIILGLTITFFS